MCREEVGVAVLQRVGHAQNDLAFIIRYLVVICPVLETLALQIIVGRQGALEIVEGELESIQIVPREEPDRETSSCCLVFRIDVFVEKSCVFLGKLLVVIDGCIRCIGDEFPLVVVLVVLLLELVYFHLH